VWGRLGLRRALLVLAGGKGSRLGRIYKPIVAFGGTPLILRIISRFTRHVNEIIVCVRDVEQAKVLARLLPCSVRLVTDVLTDYGPLAGICTGLLHSSCELTYIAPADVPYISLGTYRKLEEFVLAGYDAAVPRWPNGYIEPLTAGVRTVAAIRATRELMKLRIKKVSELYARMRTRYVPVHYLSRNPEVEFLNLNRMSDLYLRNDVAKTP